MTTQAAIDYFKGDELAASVWYNKYALRDDTGTVVENTPADTHRRMAKEFARIEANYPDPLSESDIYEYLSTWTIVPQGSPMSAIGNKSQIQSLSNCLSGDTEILTLEHGSVPIREVSGLEVHLLDGEGNWVKCPILCHGEQETYATRFSGCFRTETVRSTLHHRWIAPTGDRAILTKSFNEHNSKKEIQDLRPTKTVLNQEQYQKGCVHGLIYGDGTSANQGKAAGIRICSQHECVEKILKGYSKTYPDYANGDPVYYIKTEQTWCELKVLPSHSNGHLDQDYILGFLRGWFAADGCVSTQPNASICGDHKEMAWIKKWGPLVGWHVSGFSKLSEQTNFGKRKKESLNIFLARMSISKDDLLIAKHRDRWFDRELKQGYKWRAKGKAHSPVKELVYCPVVPTTHSFALSSGIHSGNCFIVDPPVDSYGGILLTDQELVQIMKRRGGVGVDISTIRPRGMKTSNAAGTTDGIGVFMDRYSSSCREVAQGGRRGALMISCSCLHPDIETFITIKKDKTKVTGANVSVRMTDEFLKAVKSDSEITLRWPVEASVEEAKFTKKVRAKAIWDLLVEANWESAEPGILFWDTVLNNSMSDIFAAEGYSTVTVNPCGEITLSPYDSCRLMLLNLVKFVTKPFTASSQFDYLSFNQATAIGQRLMDDLVDLEIEAVDRIIAKVEADRESSEVKSTELNLWNKIKKAASGGRRTGLGITGLGDALAMLGIKYGSAESVEVTEEIYKNLALSAHKESVELAISRGPFPASEGHIEKYFQSVKSGHSFLSKLVDWSPIEISDSLFNTGRRNIALTTTAPAGSMSIMTQTTSGCEPVFMLSYTRRKKVNPTDTTARVDFIDALGDKWTEFTVYHHGLKQWMEVTGETDITKSPYHGATANEIDWQKSVELQAAAQKWVEHAISKTCNLPNSVTKEQVSDLYFKAWESGCKGFTIYRDGSRTGVLVAKEEKKQDSITLTKAPKRPKVLKCDIHRTQIKGESYVMLVGLLDGAPYEVFCGLSKNIGMPKSKTNGTLAKNTDKPVATYDLSIPSGDDEIVIADIVELFDNPLYGAFTRTLSLSLRHGVPVQFVVEQLKKDKYSDMQSFAAAVARVLSKHYIADGTKVTGEKTCPECSSTNLSYQSGCVTCMNCGNSKCS